MKKLNTNSNEVRKAVQEHILDTYEIDFKKPIRKVVKLEKRRIQNDKIRKCKRCFKNY